MRILIIEDDRDLGLTIKNGLKNNYIVDLSFTGKRGEYLALTNCYDLIIIDLILPDAEGLSICNAIRSEKITTPILILTGENEVAKKVLAFDKGADDYLTKPFDQSELKARIRALLRRKSDVYLQETLSLDNLELDKDRRIVRRGKTPIKLRRKEIAILEYLMQNSGRVVTRDMLLEHVWNSMSNVSYNTVDVHIKYLRDSIDRKYKKKLIKTIYGAGYKIEA
ncbi:response regulator transcription factor [Candidatus Roizmanbacteria bacterium]|nr:response regulator transcription factor [Candidatus Roizmanbacteria bacterium]